MNGENGKREAHLRFAKLAPAGDLGAKDFVQINANTLKVIW